MEMKRFQVTITEKLVRKVDVMANSEYDATQKVTDRYYNSEIILDSDDFMGVEFKAEEIGKSNGKNSKESKD